MHERNQHGRGQRLDAGEMDAREEAAERSLSRLLGTLFLSAGVASGLGVIVDGTLIQVQPGAALFAVQGGLRAVTVSAARTLPLPTASGDYGVYLRPDARAELEPITVTPPQEGEAGFEPGQAASYTLYRRSLREAYARTDALSGAQGRVVTVGLSVTARNLREASWTELAVLSVVGGVLQSFTDAPTTRPKALLRGTAQAGVAEGSVGLPQLTGDVREALALGAQDVTAGRTDGSLLDTAGTHPMTGDLNLGTHRVVGNGGDFDLNGHALKGVTAIEVAGGVETLEINVARLGGQTLAQILAAAGSGGGPAAPAGAYIEVMNIETLVQLGVQTEAPTDLSGPLPANLPAGVRAVSFTGEGLFLGVTADAAHFTPNVRLFPQTPIPYAVVGVADPEAVHFAGTLIGVAGNGFFVSVTRSFTEAGTRRYAHSLQRAVPSAGQISVVDSVQGTLAELEPVPPPLSLNFVAGAVMWGTRTQAINAAQAAAWVQGYALDAKSATAVTFSKGTLAVVGKLQIAVQPAVATLALTAGTP